MSETLYKGPAPANVAADQERSVIVYGYLGREMQGFHLSSLTEPMLGNDRFDEIYFETDSGNQYALVERSKLIKDDAPDQFLLVNRRDNLERKQRGEQMIAVELPDEVIAQGSLDVGQWFDYKKGNTTKITKITAVNTNRIYQPDYLQQITEGKSDARQGFWRGLMESSGEPEKSKVEEDKNISNNDEELARIMLYPDEGSFHLYNQLVGDVRSDERQVWNPEKQKQAQAGMRELFEAALAPVRFKEGDIEGARAGLKRLKTLPEAKNTLERLSRSGRELGYQTVRNYDDLQLTGDFLHFGVNFRYSDAPDRLPESARVYVTPKIEAIGHVAAEVIRRSREKGYEPYGKVWDESTNERPVSPRKDRILFYPRTESQLRTIVESLEEIQAEHPELFEEDPPLLAEKTDIPGVGLAEDPPKIDGERLSFTQSREDLLHEAWKMTLDSLTGPEPAKKEYVTGKGGMILDKRLVDLREAATRDKATMDKVVSAFRAAVRQIAPKHRVSPDNFSRNLYS